MLLKRLGKGSDRSISGEGPSSVLVIIWARLCVITVRRRNALYIWRGSLSVILNVDKWRPFSNTIPGPEFLVNDCQKPLSLSMARSGKGYIYGNVYPDAIRGVVGSAPFIPSSSAIVENPALVYRIVSGETPNSQRLPLEYVVLRKRFVALTIHRCLSSPLPCFAIRPIT